MSFLTAGFLFSFIVGFDPSNIFEASDVLLYPEFLCGQIVEKTLMSAQLLYWLEASELFPHP